MTTHESPRGVGLPWEFEVTELSEGPTATIYDCMGQGLNTSYLSDEAAAFIVKAVNNHQVLVDFVNRVHGFFENTDAPFGKQAAAILKAVQS